MAKINTEEPKLTWASSGRCDLFDVLGCHEEPVPHVNCFDVILKFSHSEGWSPSWVHSARRSLNGLLYLSRVNMMMENLVAEKTEVLGENLSQRHFLHHKSHLTRPGLEPGPPRWESSD
jgi:hypothetical protein